MEQDSWFLGLQRRGRKNRTVKWSAEPYAESVKLKHFDGEAVFHPGVPVSEAFAKYVPDAMPTDPDALAVRKEYVARVQGIIGDLA